MTGMSNIEQNENIEIDLSVDSIESASPKFESKRGKDHIPYSDTKSKKIDGYPDYLLDLKNSCAWHGAILGYKIDQAAGKGFLVKDNDKATIEFLENINSKEDANEVLNKVAYDLEIFGGYALIVTWNNSWTKIASIEHVSFDKIRCGQVDSFGHINSYYYSYEWDKQRVNRQEYPAFDASGAKTTATKFSNAIKTSNNEVITGIQSEKTSQIFYYKPYNSSNFYYPLPSYIGCLSAIRADINSDVYGEAILKNGLTAGVHVNIIGTLDPTQKKKAASTVIHNFVGAKKGGKPFITFSKDGNSAPTVKDIPNDSTEDRYKTINEAVMQKILSGHRVTSPLLMGIGTTGTFGNKDEMINAYEVFYTTVTAPDQKKITKGFNKFMKINGLATLSIDKLGLYEDTQSENNNSEIKTNNE